jgi:hypothetical protein
LSLQSVIPSIDIINRTCFYHGLYTPFGNISRFASSS